MSFLLDTCVISQFVRKIPSYVTEWFELYEEEALYISTVTIAEINDGIERLKASKKKGNLQNFLNKMIDRFNNRILPINTQVALEWGYLSSQLRKQGKAIGTQDLYIAATARLHGMSVVTINERHFTPTGVKVINPWKFKN